MRLVLVGGGHAHIQVVRGLHASKYPQHELVLISDAPTAYYSGMVPGAVAGQYSDADCQVHLDRLCASREWQFIVASVTEINSRRQHLKYTTPNGPQAELTFDVLSVNVGSRTRTPCPLPAEHPRCIFTRPIALLNARVCDAIEAFRRNQQQEIKVAVVGAGVAGLELAFSIFHRIRNELAKKPQVTVIDHHARLLQHDQGHVMGPKLLQAASELGLMIRSGTAVDKIDALPDTNQLSLDLSGERLTADLVLIASGPAAHSWLKTASDLPMDEHGYIITRETLQVQDQPAVFAAGDCASLRDVSGFSPPKAGVYAVRAGAVLTENLKRVLSAGQEGQDSPAMDSIHLQSYHPQRHYLSLVGLGDGTAIGAKWELALQGRSIWSLKNYIDTKWMAGFKVDS